MEWSVFDRQCMERALYLASRGKGRVGGNPLVGAVLTRGETIISEGFHTAYGMPHAEVMALDKARSCGADPRGGTMYVNLEPCSHQGKTPPCVGALLESGVGRVVISTEDPNPAVHGRGVSALRAAGVRVDVGLLSVRARELNRRFFTVHELGRPYVILKWAQTIDGYIDSSRSPSDPAPWLTNRQSRLLVHKWRAEEMAILAGTNTIARDDPRLTVRYWGGLNPLRVVLDRTLRLPRDSHVFDGTTPTLVFSGKNFRASQMGDALSTIPNLELIPVDFMKGIERIVLSTLHARGVSSLIVEGGTLLLTNFMKHNLWDEARVFVGSQYFHHGVKAPGIPDCPSSRQLLGDVMLSRFRNRAPAGLC